MDGSCIQSYFAALHCLNGNKQYIFFFCPVGSLDIIRSYIEAWHSGSYIIALHWTKIPLTEL